MGYTQPVIDEAVNHLKLYVNGFLTGIDPNQAQIDSTNYFTSELSMPVRFPSCSVFVDGEVDVLEAETGPHFKILVPFLVVIDFQSSNQQHDQIYERGDNWNQAVINSLYNIDCSLNNVIDRLQLTGIGFVPLDDDGGNVASACYTRWLAYTTIDPKG